MGRTRTNVWLLCLALPGAAAWAQQTLPRARPQVVAPRVLHHPAAPAEAACTALKVAGLVDWLPFGPGETLEYSATLRGMPAGNVKLEVGEREVPKGSYPVRVTADGNAVVSLWAKLHAQATSHLDPNGARPLAFESHTQGEKVTYQERVLFDHAAQMFSVASTLNGKTTQASMPAQGHMVDAVSLLFFARGRDVKVGQAFCVDMYQSRLVWRIRGNVVRKEILNTEAGPFETFMVTGEARAQGVTRGPAAQVRPFTAWMTTDEDRIPVRLDAPTPWGNITATLTRFEQGRRLAKGPAQRPGR